MAPIIRGSDIQCFDYVVTVLARKNSTCQIGLNSIVFRPNLIHIYNIINIATVSSFTET